MTAYYEMEIREKERGAVAVGRKRNQSWVVQHTFMYTSSLK